MRLVRAKVTDFKSIDDSGWVNINDVTCLVGKNESGKTAFLGALKRLNPVNGVSGSFDLKDYPRKGYVMYKRRHAIDPAIVIRCEFKLTDAEIKAIETSFGPGVLRTPIVTVSKDYANQFHWDMDLNEQATVRQVCISAGLPPEIEEKAKSAPTIAELISILGAIEPKPASVSNLILDLTQKYKVSVRDQITAGYLQKNLPMFVYFDDYSAMRGRISIQDIRKRRDSGGYLDDADRTFLSLLTLVGADLNDLEHEQNYEHLKAELESASISISDEVFEYWQQNRQLRVEFDLSNANPNDLPPLNQGTILHCRIWNNRHRVSVSFDERSKGFVWFFSFLAYFSSLQLADENANMILLFDEPGLNLHATAQKDFLRFIDERLLPKYQVVYTTHSPFMINPAQLANVRTVQDIADKGTVITEDMITHDKETLVPLQVALGYRLAEAIFQAPHCLLVNSPSDQLYLQVLGDAVSIRGGSRLDPRWVVIPIGGADNLATYISLLGDRYVNVAVMMDVTPKSKKHIEQYNTQPDTHHSPIRMVEVTRIRNADIEDLFDSQFYLKLVNESYARELLEPLTMKSISDANARIVQRIQNYFENRKIAGGYFDTYRPAAYLLENHVNLRSGIDSSTVDRAISLFDRINACLPASAGSGRPSHGETNGASAARSTAAV